MATPRSKSCGACGPIGGMSPPACTRSTPGIIRSELAARTDLRAIPGPIRMFQPHQNDTRYGRRTGGPTRQPPRKSEPPSRTAAKTPRTPTLPCPICFIRFFVLEFRAYRGLREPFCATCNSPLPPRTGGRHMQLRASPNEFSGSSKNRRRVKNVDMPEMILRQDFFAQFDKIKFRFFLVTPGPNF